MPRRVRRMTAMTRSMNGMKSTAIGTSSGRVSGSRVAAESKVCGSIWPVAVTAAADSMSPTSIEPESPMKMRAGLKLCGRKPRHAPASTAVMIAGALATFW
jgi:hypothetical protein